MVKPEGSKFRIDVAIFWYPNVSDFFYSILSGPTLYIYYHFHEF